jgi:hypothetical protein
MLAVVVDKIFSIFQKTGGCDSKDTTTDPVFDVEVVALDVVIIITNYACSGVCVNQNQKTAAAAAAAAARGFGGGSSSSSSKRW